MVLIHEILRHAKITVKRMLVAFPPSNLLVQRHHLKTRNSPERMKLIDEYYKRGPETANKVCSILENNEIECWLYAGSLLGVVREGDFLKWDDDLDLCIIADEHFKWTRLERILNKSGYKKIREFTCNGIVSEQAYAFGDSHFDIFAMRPMGNNAAQVLIYMELPNAWYKADNELSVLYLNTYLPEGKRIINVRGWDLVVPENAEQLLERQYGSNWNVPDPDYVDGSMYRLLDNAVGEKALFVR